MWSKQWTGGFYKAPPYHKEAKAWMMGMEMALPYSMASPFPIQCYTDHTPLTWVKHTSGKGPVSQFIMDQLSVIDYQMFYIKGKDNVTADTLSRFPLLGPKILKREGLENILDYLLSALAITDVPIDKVWFSAQKERHI